MSLKNILHELKEMKDAIRCKSTRRVEGKHWRGRSKSYIAPESVEQGQWANLPPDLLLDIIRRVEASETAWSSRVVIIFCASVCRSWRDTTKEIVKTPNECKRLTFPISLKLPGPQDAPIQCYIKRDKATSTYRLHFNFEPFSLDVGVI
ncbi:hypothetical protein CDL12_12394 [Handroanthus impetiginosus]|uniref:F-box domain-containing protein n=1 Tax=Handroanthus impetiginosus TaxID=429701 RepID=A0A2G9HBS0_9LAMI|nr:hypothetical protein CDL12_12394 [Handroanthus impetiginosus]